MTSSVAALVPTPDRVVRPARPWLSTSSMAARRPGRRRPLTEIVHEHGQRIERRHGRDAIKPGVLRGRTVGRLVHPEARSRG